MKIYELQYYYKIWLILLLITNNNMWIVSAKRKSKKRKQNNIGLENLNKIENELEANGRFGNTFNSGGGNGNPGAGGNGMPNMMNNNNMGGGMPNMMGNNNHHGMPNNNANMDPQQENYFTKYRFGEFVIPLNQSYFPNNDTENIWMVMFYAPWCGACKGMRKQWALLAYRTPETIKIGSIDCTTNFNRQFCSEFKIAGFPHIKLIANKKQIEYKGRREVYDMKQFALLYRFKTTDNSKNVGKKGTKTGDGNNANNTPKSNKKRKKCKGGVYTKKSGIKEFCSTYFPDSNSKYPWLVNFYLSWDKYSKKFHKKWRTVAKNNINNDDDTQEGLPLKIGAFDCSSNEKNTEMCNDFGLQVNNSSFPMLYLVWGDAIIKYPKNPRKSSVENILKWGKQTISDDSDI